MLFYVTLADATIVVVVVFSDAIISYTNVASLEALYVLFSYLDYITFYHSFSKFGLSDETTTKGCLEIFFICIP